MNMTAQKFNEITYAIGQLQGIIGYGTDAQERVLSRYTPSEAAAYLDKCAAIDADDAAHSDTEGTY